MAINTSLLICAAILQDTFVDNATDVAMSAGVITCYQDNSRTVLKNWYYQTGSPGNYTYLPLPNPLTLSAAGTITDANGNDTIPFWYPYSETDNVTPQPYYVTVVDQNGQAQFTRQNFPFVASTPTSSEVATLDNYVINNRFWRNIGTLNAETLTTDSSTGLLSSILCPAQHDGFSMHDFQYIKNINGATETITFEKFALGSNELTDDITPEYYINHTCTSVQSGETAKYYQMPLSLHVKTLELEPAVFTIQAQNVTGNNMITISLLQFLGTGVTSPSPIVLKTISLNAGWQKYTVQFTFPSAGGATLGTGEDDAWYIQIGMPTGAEFETNFTLPSLYLSADLPNVPTNSFETYDQVDSIINTPRTGDIRTSLNAFYYFGWVPMNDGTIGNASSNANARANADTWPLFNLIWQKFNSYTSGSSNVLAQMVNSSGSPVAYGSSAISDFNANNALALTQTMGQVLLGTVPISALTVGYSNTFTATNTAGTLTLISTSNLSPSVFVGMPITFSNSGGALPTGLASNAVYYVGQFNGTTDLYISTTFGNAIAGVFIAYTNAGSGTNTLYLTIANSQEGESAHTLSRSQLPDPITETALIAGVGGGSTDVIQSSATHGSGIVSNNGGGNPFNVTQPGTFINLFMKL